MQRSTAPHLVASRWRQLGSYNRLATNSHGCASTIAFASSHSTFTRSESLTTAVRHGRYFPAPAVCHGAVSTTILCTTSGGGAAAVRRQAFFPVVLPHSAMLPNKVCCDLSLFDSTSGDEVWRRGRHLSPLLQQLCRSCETVLASPRCFVRPLARETEAGSAETQAGKE
jgi:hypothetical protein